MIGTAPDLWGVRAWTEYCQYRRPGPHHRRLAEVPGWAAPRPILAAWVSRVSRVTAAQAAVVPGAPLLRPRFPTGSLPVRRGSSHRPTFRYSHTMLLPPGHRGELADYRQGPPAIGNRPDRRTAIAKTSHFCLGVIANATNANSKTDQRIANATLDKAVAATCSLAARLNRLGARMPTVASTDEAPLDLAALWPVSNGISRTFAGRV
jgi:hypothetical protein